MRRGNRRRPWWRRDPELSPELPEIPEIPDGASPAEVGLILISVVGGLARQFARANAARDRRDQRRFLAIAFTVAGLFLDVALSVLAFIFLAGLSHANAAISGQQVVITRQADQLARQAAQIHQNQLTSCVNSNKTRATARGTFHHLLDQLLIPGATESTRLFVAANEASIDRAYAPVDCTKAYNLTH